MIQKKRPRIPGSGMRRITALKKQIAGTLAMARTTIAFRNGSVLYYNVVQ